MVTKVNLVDKLHTDFGNYLFCKRLILRANMEICCSFKSFAGGTCGFSYREERSCISQFVPLHSCKKKHFKSFAGLQVFRSRKWSWSYFVACRHLWDANRYRWFYNLQFRSGMKTPINSFRNDLFRINFTLVSCENRYELVLEQN